MADPRNPVTARGERAPTTPAAPGSAELLIRQLESQLRRSRNDVQIAVELEQASKHWAYRFAQTAPDLAAEAQAVASSLEGLTGTSAAGRLTRIGTAMRLLARVRSLSTGVAPGPVRLGAALDGVAATSEEPGRGQEPKRRMPAPAVPPRPAFSERPSTRSAISAAPMEAMRVSHPVQGPASQRSPALTKRAPRTHSAGVSRAAPAAEWTLVLPIAQMPGFRRPYAAPLQKLGIKTAGDLLRHYPRRYQDYSKLLPIAQLRPGEEVTVEAAVLHCEAVGFHGGRGRRVEATFVDGTGSVRAVWFGQEWRARQLNPGARFYVSGKVEAFGGRLQFTHPDVEGVTEAEAIHTGRLVPVYPTSGEMPVSWLRGRIKWATDAVAHLAVDAMPEPLRRRWDLTPLSAALQGIHFPDDEGELQAARRRIAFDDLFLLQLGLLKQRQEWLRMRAVPLPLAADRRRELESRLPFRLTPGQQSALDEVLADVARDRPMGRLLQGDVGSGKTVIAALAALAAVSNDCQAVVVAPTEILAEQHARTLAALFADLMPMLKPVLITGSMSAGAKATAWRQLANGQAAVAVGTHALFSERGTFSRLALVVIDEQHRFGVYQRDTLWRKGERPHLLAMTATPIPRTLALQKFGDLDLSTIDTLPEGRRPILTRYAAAAKREAVYAFVRAQVEAGRQAYVICPLVDESEAVSAKAVTAEFRRLQEEVFPDLRLGLVHGRLKSTDKDEAMRRFRDGETQVLVATTVIEVGVDVPNASVMLIEGAERFGLAQLHQLRGRVGRGAAQSYCVLMASEEIDEAADARLRLVASTSDGFALAEADLQQRRTGTFFGSAQSGDELLLRWAAYVDPIQARRAAEEVLAADPELSRPEHALLAERVAKLLPSDGAAADSARPADATASLAYV